MPRKKTELNESEMINHLKQAPAYRVAYKDLDFMDGDHTRPVRLQLELLKTEVGMLENNVKSTIVVFGGTRIVEPIDAERKVQAVEAALNENPDDPVLQRDLRIAKSIQEKSSFYDEAREFAAMVSKEGQDRNEANEWVIVTGGGPGIMEAANRGAHEVGAKSCGLNITLPMEQEPNAYITPELCFQFHYFAIRKLHFMMRAKALLAFPGGYGTLDELFEGLTLVQTHKVRALPIILFGRRYWKGLINFDYLVEQGTIDPDDIKLFSYADTAKDAWDYIKRFYNAD